jgi:hypothetical protein
VVDRSFKPTMTNLGCRCERPAMDMAGGTKRKVTITLDPKQSPRWRKVLIEMGNLTSADVARGLGAGGADRQEEPHGK